MVASLKIGCAVMLFSLTAQAQSLTLVELNCENLFDTRHDSLKQDTEYLPEATRHWNRRRYWRKLNNIGQSILSTCDNGIPDLVALCEVENDSVMHDLARRSVLRNAGYDYMVTQSPDLRGIDVGLLYRPSAFMPLNSHCLRVETVEGMRPTRDILYVSGRVLTGDTLHVYVVHAPSRYGGERHSRPFRMQVARRLCQSADSVLKRSAGACILVAGDFNDEADSPALRLMASHGLNSMTAKARGENGVSGTYRYKGRWSRIDHILGTAAAQRRVDTTYIHSAPFLLEEEHTYSGYRPRRTYNGMNYQPGYSDHLPLVLRLRWK